MRLLPTLDTHEHNLEIRGIWLQPIRLFIIGSIAAAVASFSRALGVLLVLAAAGALAKLIQRSKKSQEELADKLDWLVFGAKEFQQLMKGDAMGVAP